MTPQRKFALRVTVADIQASVCNYYGLNRDELIGRSFGGRDHTTVKHACEAVDNRCAHYPEPQADLDAIMADLKPVPRAEYFRRDTVYGRFVSLR